MSDDRDKAREYSEAWLRHVLPEDTDGVRFCIYAADERCDLWRPQAAGASGHTWFHQDGFACLIDFTQMGQPVRVEWVRDLVAHEFLHFVEWQAATTPEERHEAATTPVEDVSAAELVGIQHVYGVATRDYPWFDHGDSFIRLCVHLWWRSIASDWRMWSWNVLGAGSLYRLSDISEYQIALGREPEQCADLPLVDVARTPVPYAFREFFRWDCQQYHKRQKEVNQ